MAANFCQQLEFPKLPTFVFETDKIISNSRFSKRLHSIESETKLNDFWVKSRYKHLSAIKIAKHKVTSKSVGWEWEMLTLKRA